MWEFGTIPLELFVAVLVVLVVELPVTFALANRLNALIEWIKERETR